MKQTALFNLQQKVNAIAMVIAPLLLAASSFVSLTGNGNNSDALGGALVVYAFFVFIFVILGLTQLLAAHAPRFAMVMRVVGIFGCVGGVNWGMDSAIRGVLLTNVDAATAQLSAETVVGALPHLLELPGLILPISMVILGIALLRYQLVPAPAALLLALAGLTFPVGRIPDIEPVYIVTDLAFVISLIWISRRSLTQDTQLLPNYEQPVVSTIS